MSIARFEKISKKQFDMDFDGFDCGMDDVLIPKRATKGSAGYDFYCPIDVDIKAHGSIKIPTGIRCFIEEGYVLKIYPRSSFGFKYHMGLLNTVGIIDSDYYGANNEGHIIIGVVNNGDSDMHIKKGERFVQGIFEQYLLADEDDCLAKREGGFGSTD